MAHPVIEAVIIQHAEEATFPWLLRDAGWKLRVEQLAHNEPGKVFAATMLAQRQGAEG